MNPRTHPRLSTIGFTAVARQLVVHDALEMMWCFSGAYLSAFTQSTRVISSPLAGAEMMTFFAPPPEMCKPALAASVKRPVDSMTTSAPRSFHGSLAGSRSSSALVKLRPIRPKPLIPMRIKKLPSFALCGGLSLYPSGALAQPAREAGDEGQPAVHGCLRHGRTATPAQLGKRFIAVLHPQLRDLANRRRELAQAVCVRDERDRLALCGGRADGAVQIGGFRIHQAPYAIFRLLDRTDVFQLEHGAVRADLAEHGDDLIQTFVVDHVPRFARGVLRRDAELHENLGQAREGRVVADDKLEVIAVRRRRERAAGQECAAGFHPPLLTRARHARVRRSDGNLVGRRAIEARARNLLDGGRVAREHA